MQNWETWLDPSAALDAATNAGMAGKMLLLDAAFRFSAITLLMLMSVFALRDARHLLQGRLAAAVGICLSAMLLNTLPSWYDIPFALFAVAWVLHIPNIVLIWLFGLSLFEDDFRMRPVHWGAIAASFIFVSGIQTSIYVEHEIGTVIFVVLNRVLGLAVLAHLFWTALSGRKDDLIEARRRTRLWFILGTSLTALLIISAESIHFGVTFDNADPDWFSTVRVLVAWPMIIFATLWFSRIPPETLLFERIVPGTPHKPSIDPRDSALHERLVRSMEIDEQYRELGLGIGDLARKLGVPEHQLRALINQGLGHRNFASFLNGYRLREAKKALSDPEQARTPILTIAMDVGYASLATFNRAFKAELGMPPSAFRAEALSKSSQS